MELENNEKSSELSEIYGEEVYEEEAGLQFAKSRPEAETASFAFRAFKNPLRDDPG